MKDSSRNCQAFSILHLVVLKLPWFREKFASENAVFCISAWCLRKLDKEDEKIPVLQPLTPSWISNRNSGDRTTLNMSWLCLSLQAGHRLFSRCFLRPCSSGSSYRILWSGQGWGHQPLAVTGQTKAQRWWIDGQGITEPKGSGLGMQAENIIQEGCCQGILSCLVVSLLSHQRVWESGSLSAKLSSTWPELGQVTSPLSIHCLPRGTK